MENVVYKVCITFPEGVINNTIYEDFNSNTIITFVRKLVNLDDRVVLTYPDSEKFMLIPCKWIKYMIPFDKDEYEDLKKVSKLISKGECEW